MSSESPNNEGSATNTPTVEEDIKKQQQEPQAEATESNGVSTSPSVSGNDSASGNEDDEEEGEQESQLEEGESEASTDKEQSEEPAQVQEQEATNIEDTTQQIVADDTSNQVEENQEEAVPVEVEEEAVSEEIEEESELPETSEFPTEQPSIESSAQPENTEETGKDSSMAPEDAEILSQFKEPEPEITQDTGTAEALQESTPQNENAEQIDEGIQLDIPDLDEPEENNDNDLIPTGVPNESVSEFEQPEPKAEPQPETEVEQVQEQAEEKEEINEYQEAEMRQEMGEEEELRKIQADDPSFDADFNVDELDKSKDDFDTSFLDVPEDEDQFDEDIEMTNVEDEEEKEEETGEVTKDEPTAAETKVEDEAKPEVEELSKQDEQEDKIEEDKTQDIVDLPGSESTAEPSISEKPNEDERVSTAASTVSVVEHIKSEAPPPSTDNQENKLEQQVQAPQAPDAIVEDEEEEDEEEEEEGEEDNQEKQAYTKQTHLIVIPSYASWFNMKKIHKIEKESLPEFFDTNHPSKSSKLYVNYRNFMINSYRLNPNEFLTLTSCRRNLVGDVGTLMRVHRFLNKWGLINYQVKPQFKPGYAVEKMPNGQSVDLPFTGDYHVKYDTPRGLFPFDTSRIPPERIDVTNLKKLLVGPETTSATTASSGSSNADASRGASAGSAADQNGNHDNRKHGLEDNESSQVTKKQRVNDGWTSEEENQLSIAVKKFKNDWFKIAAEVGTDKTPEQCILKFLGLDIEDSLNPFNDENSPVSKLLKFAPNYPISSIDNPALANLAFLTRLVDSDVAKAASEAARKAIDSCIEKKVNEVYNKSQGEEGKLKMEGSSDAVELPVASEQNGSVDREPDVRDAVGTAFGIVGGRSHLFASYEEREMHKIAASIVNQELSKIEQKLNKIEQLERIYETEHQNLLRQQQDVFIDRLALSKSSINVIKKLENAIELIETNAGNENSERKANVASLLSEAKSLLYKPARQMLVSSSSASAVTDATTNQPSKQETTANIDEDDYKPLSLKSPQNFKVWVP
ncbi:SWI3 [[Candida] subhashii]|uniref:SWI3 n=1 Tax=[Candida] subhashii TaxID=561895 RepID=A0A8J5QS31_9ASCO|nr:SWI3 [[Candida] subhashii]KAG7661870.1 SWI3 [[Candida] subhashii]